jgi:RNA polymerase sigma-70 factor, ECF subfamily
VKTGTVNPKGTTGEARSDWSLLARIGQKDEVALSALYDRYVGLVFSEAKRILRNTRAAEEILQDLFYQIWRTPERFDGGKGSLAGWLLLSARNRAISRLRPENGRNDELDENGVALSLNVETHAAQNLLIDKVRKVIASLPGNQREALEHAYFEGMAYVEIAKKSGQPSEMVKTGIRDAMKALKKVLG